LVVDASGSPRGLRLALRRTAPDGVCSCAGGLARRVGIPFTEAYGRNVTLHVARAHARAIIPRVIELIADGSLRPETVTAVTAGIDDAPAALREHVRAGHTKTVLVA
jgi:alcohol dehydrogenase